MFWKHLSNKRYWFRYVQVPDISMMEGEVQKDRSLSLQMELMGTKIGLNLDLESALELRDWLNKVYPDGRKEDKPATVISIFDSKRRTEGSTPDPAG